MARRTVIGIMGGHAVGAEVEHQAESLGRAVAEEGWVTLTGGRKEGIMRAATKGARDAGGLTIGIHPGSSDQDDVADAEIVVFTGIGFARNMTNVLTSDVIVCLPGSFGTLNEAAYARTFGKPLIVFGFKDHGVLGDVARVNTVEGCIRAIKEALA